MKCDGFGLWQPRQSEQERYRVSYNKIIIIHCIIAIFRHVQSTHNGRCCFFILRIRLLKLSFCLNKRFFKWTRIANCKKKSLEARYIVVITSSKCKWGYKQIRNDESWKAKRLSANRTIDLIRKFNEHWKVRQIEVTQKACAPANIPFLSTLYYYLAHQSSERGQKKK